MLINHLLDRRQGVLRLPLCLPLPYPSFCHHRTVNQHLSHPPINRRLLTLLPPFLTSPTPFPPLSRPSPTRPDTTLPATSQVHTTKTIPKPLQLDTTRSRQPQPDPHTQTNKYSTPQTTNHRTALHCTAQLIHVTQRNTMRSTGAVDTGAAIVRSLTAPCC